MVNWRKVLWVAVVVCALFGLLFQAGAVIRGSGGGAAATPDASYALDAAGGSGSAQVYDSIATSWKGGGADTMNFVGSDYVEGDSTSDRGYIPGSDAYYSDIVTFEFEYQVSVATDSLYAIYYSSGGDSIMFRHYSSSGNGKFSFRANYGSTVDCTFSNSGLAVDTWHKVYAIVDISGQDMYVYINGSLLQSVIDNASIADPVALGGSFYYAYEADGTDTSRMRDLKIYNQSVTP